jgi:molybdopterin-guanine dinucleotide biosynthesis protein A
MLQSLCTLLIMGTISARPLVSTSLLMTSVRSFAVYSVSWPYVTPTGVSIVVYRFDDNLHCTVPRVTSLLHELHARYHKRTVSLHTN